MPQQLIDVGEHCVDCGDSVAWGSGKYVNRIPADNGVKTGFMCADCQCVECDRCGEPTLEYHSEAGDEPFSDADFVCDDCLTPEELEKIENG